jgi:hypothetical protein
VIALCEERDYIIPDDIKISTLSILPSFNMNSEDATRRLLNSVQVPSVVNGEVEMDIIVAPIKSS